MANSVHELASHANVLRGSSRVPIPRGRGMIAWRTRKNVCVGGYPWVEWGWTIWPRFFNPHRPLWHNGYELLALKTKSSLAFHSNERFLLNQPPEQVLRPVARIFWGGAGGGAIQRGDGPNKPRSESPGPRGGGAGILGCLRLYYEQSTSVLKNIG